MTPRSNPDAEPRLSLPPLDRRNLIKMAAAGCSVALLPGSALWLSSCSSSRTGNGDSTPGGSSTLPFEDNFDRPDGPVGNGWTDAHSVVSTLEDEVAIRDGKLALASLQGPTDQNDQYSGWRGAIYRETGTARGIRVLTSYSPDTLDASGGPLVHCKPDSTSFGVGAWYNHVLSAFELGLIGLHQRDWQYLDFNFAPRPELPVALELRSDGANVALFVNDELAGGPVALPTDLIGSSLHGAQLDYLTNIPGTPTLADCRIDRWDGSLGGYGPPDLVAAGPIASATGGAQLEVQSPDGSEGDLLIAILMRGSGGPVTWTAGGWNQSLKGGVGGAVGLNLMQQVTTEASGATTTFDCTEASAFSCGYIVRISGQNTTVPLLGSLTENDSSTEIDAGPAQVLGQHRLAVWLAATPGDVSITPPDGYDTQLSSRVGDALTVHMAVADVDSVPGGKPPYGYRGNTTGIVVGHASNATPSAAGLLMVNPQP